MNDQDILDRFEELEAGRILGDLDHDEVREWQKLSEDPRCQSDLSLELAAAALEAEFHGGDEIDLPTELLKDLKGGMSGFITSEPEEVVVAHPAWWQGLASSPKMGWAIAALFALLFIVKSFVDTTPAGADKPIVIAPDPPSPEEARQALLSNAGDLIKSDFGGIKNYNQMSGTVVWSDELQEGYMSLTNLPANDPSAKQYQLWIVDPDRDEMPVDGGVFDISASDRTVIIPIRNPLVVTNPQTFVITLEQPGGVVVSKQEVVVALAKTS